MKAALSISAVVCVTAAAVFLWRAGESAPPVSRSPVPAPSRGPAPTSVNADPADVFQRAFWKRPTGEDRIEAAERREWADADGVNRWQWFIKLKPSAALVKHLREDNAFDLRPSGEIPVSDGAPSWFSFKRGEVEVLEAPRGHMRLVFSKDGKVLLATDSGGGFQQGVSHTPQSAPAPVPDTVQGRLPVTSPPKPNP
ncbi:hypothetical protein JIN84_01590 [Luteolibacter yonseiensis]|uniref:Uncharacterized protein n=1 Tax=Luteolibacter yonseiensis TaxID=1144680 RepID=A0A934R2V6_9BACT|nr:hypothetical protein [Luteolibacter yonseiensis]MBK1814300.1 hypothetical protein [Luteolibacter yonseiensis]